MEMKKDELFERFRLQINAHSYYEMRRKAISVTTKIVLLVFPAIITFLASADTSILGYIFSFQNRDDVLVPITIISFILFITSILVEIFGVNEKHKLHRNAIDQFVKLRDEFGHEIDKEPSKEIEITKKYRDIFLEIIKANPTFTENEFIKAKEYNFKKQKRVRRIEEKYHLRDVSS